MSGRDEIVLGAITFSPALAPDIIDSMAESIVDCLIKLAEVEHLKVKLAEVEAERDFYKAAAGKLMQSKPHNGRRKK